LRRKCLYSKYKSKNQAPELAIKLEDPFPSSETAKRPHLTLANKRDLGRLMLDMLAARKYSCS
jgi:hypothetical protein